MTVSDAKVVVARLKSLTINPMTEEKTPDELHPLVRDMYLQKGYHNNPRNGPRAAFGNIHFHYIPDEGHEIEADLRPARYGHEEAMRDLMKGERPIPWEELVPEMEAIMADATIGSGLTLEMRPGRYHFEEAMRDVEKVRREAGRPLTWDEAREMDPRMAHASCLILSRYTGPTSGHGLKHNDYTPQRGDPVIVGQIKGNVLGAGQFIACLVGRGVASEYVIRAASDPTVNPFIEALKEGAPIKLGMDMSDIEHSDFHLLVAQRGVGNLNLGCVSYKPLEELQHSHEGLVSTTPFEKLEVKGFGILPVNSPESARNGMWVFEGGDWKFEKRVMRPYSDGIIDHLAKKGNRKAMMELAGF